MLQVSIVISAALKPEGLSTTDVKLSLLKAINLISQMQ